MFNYALIDELGYCIAISSLTGEVENRDMILIDQYDANYIGRKFNRITNQWTDEYLPEPERTFPISLNDIKGDTTPIKETTTLTADDALTIMEYQTVLDEKLTKIITHLGL